MVQDYKQKFGLSPSKTAEQANGRLTPPTLGTRPPCRYMAEKGYCLAGSTCKFSHAVTIKKGMFNLQSSNPRGSTNGGTLAAAPQPLEHVPVCKFYITGGQCPDGEDCEHRHVTYEELETEPKTSYSVENLKTIGAQCSSQLPPASAVQAMFLYEMQRHAEVERLFHGQLFRIARAEDVTNTTDARVLRLEAEIKKTQQQVSANEVQERVAAGKHRFDLQQNKIDALTTDLQKQQERSERLTADLAAFQEAKAAGSEEPEFTYDDLIGELGFMKGDIDKLEEEKADLIIKLSESNVRIAKLEDCVRQLTLQSSLSPSPSTASPATVHRVPIQTKDGQSIELSVPKGSGLTAIRKENRDPAQVRASTPGKQWA